MNRNNRAQLHKYEPPNWASSLKSIPKYSIKLAQRNTPIHSWNLPDAPKEFSIFIKRDDLTGCALSGNKVRKLEFVLADALDKKCDTVITCGGLPSNHCRTTAVAAKQLGLNCYLLLRSSNQETVNVGYKGNRLLSRMAGSNIILVPELKYKSGLKPMMEKMAEKLRQQGSAPYLVEVGGSSYTGLFGYLTAFQEMMDQNLLVDFDDIVLTVGSGGTAAGIAIANYLTGSKLKCHAVNVYDDDAYVYSKINEELQAAGLPVQAEDIIDVIGGHHLPGYGRPTQEDLEYVLEISSSTGVFIDPVYNIKAVRGMLAEMNNNPERFQGNRILYIHTGGCFGLFDGKIDSVLTSSRCTQYNSEILCWRDINDPLPI
ncbi:bifunctional D-cysteine desulfhydrase/1-aminocyclopropane-1-carboxylate deaminase, mitochondrial-like [Stylophora pistillata]|uniref:Putative 1-aminocyclopropane-1-carboxylate deaminase n=1 Tax=Stylophora pistillata TaxID=50429 RepID=A0A2B4S9S6_STYPI|nr:bifunctional D-cysteine desulfhydrase/1-aminocyclopropane-1-carboxylate deaminase, mitochondrial-like [Stylophora pistillata]PFX26631.1 putative 1-aminocyclopropane-1-carboxylate deaminase [Stylophora pistillata]